jgi:hypothetical protein
MTMLLHQYALRLQSMPQGAHEYDQLRNHLPVQLQLSQNFQSTIPTEPTYIDASNNQSINYNSQLEKETRRVRASGRERSTFCNF